MKRWCVKVGLFNVPTTWDAETKRLGWAFYKMNNATAVAGRWLFSIGDVLQVMAFLEIGGLLVKRELDARYVRRTG